MMMSDFKVATKLDVSSSSLDVSSSKLDKSNDNEYVEPTTPFEVIHDDLEMYRSIVDAFKLLSSKHDGKKYPKLEKESAKKHIQRLSLMAFGFDEQLAAMALESTNYDITKAVEFCQKNNINVSTSYFNNNKQDNLQHIND